MFWGSSGSLPVSSGDPLGDLEGSLRSLLGSLQRHFRVPGRFRCPLGVFWAPLGREGLQGRMEGSCQISQNIEIILAL